MPTPSAPALPARRAPTQDRGMRRIDAILDAAEALLCEVGIDALTLTEVAARSDSSIGSLYRFFSSKDQLLDALADRVGTRAEASPPPPPPATMDEISPTEFADWFVRALDRTIRAHPALPVLLHRLGDHCEPLRDRTMAPLHAYLGVHGRHLSARERAMIERVSLDLIDVGTTAHLNVRGAKQSDSLREIRIVLGAYLQVRLARS